MVLLYDFSLLSFPCLYVGQAGIQKKELVLDPSEGSGESDNRPVSWGSKDMRVFPFSLCSTSNHVTLCLFQQILGDLSSSGQERVCTGILWREGLEPKSTGEA